MRYFFNLIKKTLILQYGEDINYKEDLDDKPADGRVYQLP